jgi:hypothetical protein
VHWHRVKLVLCFGTFGALGLAAKHDFLLQNSSILEQPFTADAAIAGPTTLIRSKTPRICALCGMVFTTELS